MLDDASSLCERLESARVEIQDIAETLADSENPPMRAAGSDFANVCRSVAGLLSQAELWSQENR